MDVTLETEYLDSLELSGLNLEVYAEPALNARADALLRFVPPLWSEFLALAQQEGIFSALGLLPPEQVLEIELHWVGNAAMQSLNREARGKDMATDVLTFSLFADHPDPAPWKSLPVIQLGSVFIGIEWAEAEVCKNPALNLERYLMERFIHGLLHLLGVHHDTMEQFNRVVRLQQILLDSVFNQIGSCVTDPMTEANP
jgi:probable rRNA maturation factor